GGPPPMADRPESLSRERVEAEPGGVVAGRDGREHPRGEVRSGRAAPPEPLAVDIEIGRPAPVGGARVGVRGREPHATADLEVADRLEGDDGARRQDIDGETVAPV